MTVLNKRREGFEAKFAQDEQLRFRVDARRNKLLGYWAADQLGLTGAEKEAYAIAVVVSDLEEAGEEDVFRKLREDFDNKCVMLTDQQIRSAMSLMRVEAMKQIWADWP